MAPTLFDAACVKDIIAGGFRTTDFSSCTKPPSTAFQVSFGITGGVLVGLGIVMVVLGIAWGVVERRTIRRLRGIPSYKLHMEMEEEYAKSFFKKKGLVTGPAGRYQSMTLQETEEDIQNNTRNVIIVEDLSKAPDESQSYEMSTPEIQEEENLTTAGAEVDYSPYKVDGGVSVAPEIQMSSNS